MIHFKSEEDLIQHACSITHHARELRFWDNYLQMNQGEYARIQRDLNMTRLDGIFKKIKMNNTERLAALKYILQAKNI
jgi:hypothetical protein